MFQTNGSTYNESTSGMTQVSPQVKTSSLEIHTRQTVRHSADLHEKGMSFSEEFRGGDLKKRFEDYLSDGLNKEIQVKWDGNSEVEVKGANSFDLQRFILEMEKEGRKIEFVKTTTIKIS